MNGRSNRVKPPLFAAVGTHNPRFESTITPDRSLQRGTLLAHIMDLAPGTHVGPYAILERIGAGGMSVVYRAHDHRLGRDVAIKFLLGDLATDPTSRARFEREARAVATLSHPNILEIYDIGNHEGASYLVTELLQGETLRSRLERSRIDCREAQRLGAAIADGVAAAHSRGLVHRDLKPDNIFLTSDNRVKILDFGLAGVRGGPDLGSSSQASTLTRPGTLMGTVGYMSPEQVRGETANAPSDVFSLGCVLYEMLTGRQPFAEETAVQTLHAILEKHPQPVSTLIDACPKQVQDAVERCLKKTAAVRTITARDVADTLRQRTTATHATVETAANLPRRLLLAGSIAALVAAVVVGFAISKRPDRESTRSSDIEALAVLPLENLSGAAAQDYFADGMTEAITTELAGINDLKVIARPAVMKYKGTLVPPHEIARELDVDALVTGSVLRSSEAVRVSIQLVEPQSGRTAWSHTYERPLAEVLDLQRDISRAIALRVEAPVDPSTRSQRRATARVDPEAYDAYLRILYLSTTDTTPSSVEQSMELAQLAVQRSPEFAAGHAALARVLIMRRSYVAPEEAQALEQRAFAALERALLLDPDLADAYVARAELLWTQSHRFAHARAVQQYRRALQSNPNLDIAHEGMARIFAHIGFFDAALRHVSKALELNPSNGRAVHHQSEVLVWKGDDEQALAVLNTIPTPLHSELVAAHTAWALARLNRHDEARASLAKSLQRYPDDPNGVLTALEALFLAPTDPSTAMGKIERAISRGGFNPSHHTEYFVGCAWAQMRDAEKAVSHLRKAVDTGFPCLPLLEEDPSLDPIRDQPVFQAFLADVQQRTERLRSTLFSPSS